MELHILEY